MTKALEKIMVRDARGDGTEIEAEKIGALFVHPGLGYNWRHHCVTAPCGWALGWFKNRREAVAVARDIQAAFPGANWQGSSLAEIWPAGEDQRRAADIVIPRRVA